MGLANPGTFAIGDTLCDGVPVRYDGIPPFAPEHFALVRNVDTASYKSFQKGIAQLREEGAIQVFHSADAARMEPVLAAVGPLQFEVTKYRLAERVQRQDGTDRPALHAGDAGRRRRRRDRSRARPGRRTRGSSTTGTVVPVALFESEWSMRLAQEWNPKLELRAVRRTRSDGGTRVKKLTLFVAVVGARRLLRREPLRADRGQRDEGDHGQRHASGRVRLQCDRPSEAAEPRARRGTLRPVERARARFKRIHETTARDAPQGEHTFDAVFDKATWKEIMTIDSDGKIASFYVHPPSADATGTE